MISDFFKSKCPIRSVPIPLATANCKCPYCPKKCKSKAALIQHIRSHPSNAKHSKNGRVKDNGPAKAISLSAPIDECRSEHKEIMEKEEKKYIRICRSGHKEIMEEEEKKEEKIQTKPHTTRMSIAEKIKIINYWDSLETQKDQKRNLLRWIHANIPNRGNYRRSSLRTLLKNAQRIRKIDRGQIVIKKKKKIHSYFATRKLS